jgi:ubiquinone/menaquinone biosynthesis C-methylase UbiE
MDKQTQKKLLDIVKRNYEEIAEDFSETRNKQLWPELIKLTEEVKNGDKVLDVGCGNGRLLEAFKGKEIEYIGVDNSKKLIELAKKRNWKLEIGNWKFIIGDILELSKLPQINFDYVYCVAVLQHIPGRGLQVAALKQLKNKINEQGKIIITVWNLWSQNKFRRLILRFALLKLIKKNKMDFGDVLFDWKNSKGERVSRRYYHAFRMAELRKIIKKAGLKIEKIYKDQYNYYAVLKK